MKTGSTDGTYNAVNWKTGSTDGTKNAVNLKKRTSMGPVWKHMKQRKRRVMTPAAEVYIKQGI